MTLTVPTRHSPSAALDWAAIAGREIGSEQLDETPPPWRIVACLNVWNDAKALRHTLQSWLPFVDRIVAVDGAYATAGGVLSTDGTRELLQAVDADVIDGAGGTQFDKRNAYLNACGPGDLLFVVDADEVVAGAETLRDTPMLDVGWCRIQSELYQRPYGQPRVFRWRPGLQYRGRHHWLYEGDQLLATHQYGGVGYDHRVLPLSIANKRGLGHSRERGTAKRFHASAQMVTEAPQVAEPRSAMSDRKLGHRESLRIVQAALMDAGMAPSRLHTAINRTTPHASLFFKREAGPFGVGSQYSVIDDAALLRSATADADVVHFHVATMGIPARSSAREHVVLHHHGTALRRDPKAHAREAESRKALVLVSNLELLTHAPDAQFLPNPVPVARYRRLRTAPEWTGGPFRVAHSPSKPEKKSTAEFQQACLRLHALGYPIQPVIITGVSHCDALALKATCHAAFDSFWLGMQCSGIEAAAMGMPVIAGDETCARRYEEHFGAVPYTFADTENQLVDALARLMQDAEYRARETARVTQHVLAFHDEAAVALRYLDLLDERFGWRR